MEAQIDKRLNEYAKRPRKQFIGANTREYRFAQYLEDWRLKIERIGTLNYPEAARGRLYGSLLLSVVIRADGSLEKVEVQRSSGQRILDEAAVRIVEMSAPFAPFPPEIRTDTDIIEIVRTWRFTNADQMRAQ
jgi:protein TonB